MEGVRLFDVFPGAHWTLPAVGTEEQLPPLPGVRTVRIASSDRYGTGVFLVRPDGYVGWAGTGARDLPRYAHRVGPTVGQGL
ncbi:hypothetical protein [Streptomyces sp. NBC_01571]|uniref:aromatic-ring hydroxylase C-terminal domain-containing protein n=1 Tax=Streptomyces sp. NBC_01571 TaxID=2975883 RepID=UPI002B1CBECB|nr:hypothetical protein [Streptomyces sp. NBC_01571]